MNLNHEEIKMLFIAVTMISAFIYCISMTIYIYKFESEKLPVIWMIASVVAATVIICNYHVVIGVIFSILSSKGAVDINLGIVLIIMLSGFLMFFNEKISLLFLSISISIFIIFVSSFVIHL